VRLFRIIALFAIIVLVGCANRNGFEPYVAQAGATKLGKMNYRLANVDLVLSGSEVTDHYLSQDALQEAFHHALQSQIEVRGLSGNDYDLGVTVKWDRRMLGSDKAPKDVFSSAGCWFESSITKNGSIVAHDAGDPLNATSIKYEHKNILNNLKCIGDSLTRTGDPESEIRELERCARLLVERLPE